MPEPFAQAALDSILELRLKLGLLEIASTQPLDFQITIWEEDYPRETFPLEGWFTVPPTL